MGFSSRGCYINFNLFGNLFGRCRFISLGGHIGLSGSAKKFVEKTTKIRNLVGNENKIKLILASSLFGTCVDGLMTWMHQREDDLPENF